MLGLWLGLSQWLERLNQVRESVDAVARLQLLKQRLSDLLLCRRLYLRCCNLSNRLRLRDQNRMLQRLRLFINVLRGLVLRLEGGRLNLRSVLAYRRFRLAFKEILVAAEVLRRLRYHWPLIILLSRLLQCLDLRMVGFCLLLLTSLQIVEKTLYCLHLNLNSRVGLVTELVEK